MKRPQHCAEYHKCETRPQQKAPKDEAPVRFWIWPSFACQEAASKQKGRERKGDKSEQH